MVTSCYEIEVAGNKSNKYSWSIIFRPCNARKTSTVEQWIPMMRVPGRRLRSLNSNRRMATTHRPLSRTPISATDKISHSSRSRITNNSALSPQRPIQHSIRSIRTSSSSNSTDLCRHDPITKVINRRKLSELKWSFFQEPRNTN